MAWIQLARNKREKTGNSWEVTQWEEWKVSKTVQMNGGTAKVLNKLTVAWVSVDMYGAKYKGEYRFCKLYLRFKIILAIDCYTVRFSPCLTDKRRPNDPPEALPALRRTPRDGEV
jgi:hypothetical protein